jgi:hypothetical protein
MPNFNDRSFYLKIDPELRMVHTNTTECPAAKVGSKYGYLEGVVLMTVEDAEALDKRGLRPCDWCLKREQKLRAKQSRVPHVSPPGFRH